MVSIDKGLKAYQGVDFINGKPVNSGWKSGKMVQRSHYVCEYNGFIYLVIFILIYINI